ncbi:MAG: PEP-CTERM sorting domain-containing protein [Fimbriimonadales bacterium]
MKRKILYVSILTVAAAASQAITLTFHNSVGGKSQAVNVSTGGNGHQFMAGAMDITLGGGPHVEAYCVDLLHSVSNGNSYNVNVKPMSMQGPYGDRAAWLFQTYAPAVDTSEKGAALQLAIWDVVSDGGDGFGAGWFQTSETGSLLSQAQTYLNASIGQSGSAYWLEATGHGEHNDRNQNLMTTVPEPSSIAAVAVGAMALLRRRRK